MTNKRKLQYNEGNMWAEVRERGEEIYRVERCIVVEWKEAMATLKDEV